MKYVKVYLQWGLKLNRGRLKRKSIIYEIERFRLGYYYNDFSFSMFKKLNATKKTPFVVIFLNCASLIRALHCIQGKMAAMPAGVPTAVGVIVDNNNETGGTIYINGYVCLVAERSVETLIATMEQKKWWREDFLPNIKDK